MYEMKMLRGMFIKSFYAERISDRWRGIIWMDGGCNSKNTKKQRYCIHCQGWIKESELRFDRGGLYVHKYSHDHDDNIICIEVFRMLGFLHLSLSSSTMYSFDSRLFALHGYSSSMTYMFHIAHTWTPKQFALRFFSFYSLFLLFTDS